MSSCWRKIGCLLVLTSAFTVGLLSSPTIAEITDLGDVCADDPARFCDDQLFVGISTVGQRVVDGATEVDGPYENVSVGRNPGAGIGTLVVKNGATLDARRVFAGHSAIGTLVVSSGGRVENISGPASTGHSFVGADTTAIGSATVTGPGSQWIIDTELIIGQVSAAGMLTVAAGGVVATKSGLIDFGGGNLGSGASVIGAKGKGMAVVTGAGSQLNFKGHLLVGQDFEDPFHPGAGSGVLTIAEGGSVTVPDVSIGFGNTPNAEQASGVINVQGAGSLLNLSTAFFSDAARDQTSNSARLVLGRVGSGVLNVTGGGQVFVTAEPTANQAELAVSDPWQGPGGAQGPAGPGTVNILGPGSRVEVSGTDRHAHVSVGTVGRGTVNIDDGGVLVVSGVSSGLLVGRPGPAGDPGIGTVTVTGSGSQIQVSGTQPRIAVGENGGTGTVVAGSGSQIQVSGTQPRIAVGENGGTGTVEVIDGGLVLVGGTDGRLDLGLGGGARGMATVAGLGSQIGVARLLVGQGFSSTGTGSLAVENGGRVEVARVDVGLGVQGAGELIVRGAGSVLRLSGQDPVAPPGVAGALNVGAFGGTGSLLVLDGGKIEMDSTGVSGGDPNVVFGSRLRVGEAFGLATKSVGVAAIRGAGSQVTINTGQDVGGVIVGSNAAGALTVAEGGAITVNGPTSVLRVAREGGSGTLTVERGGSITITGARPRLQVGLGLFGVGLAAGDTGTLNILDGGRVILTSTDGQGHGRIAPAPSPDGSATPPTLGTVTVAGAGSLLEVPNILTLGLPNDNLPVEPGGSAVLTVARGGTVRVSPCPGGGLPCTGILRIGELDILRGDGVVDATVESFGGLVVPGLSPGTLTVTGNYVGGPGSRLALGVDASGGHSRLQVGGTLALDPTSKIDVSVDPALATSQTLTLIESGAGSFLQVSVASTGEVVVQASPDLRGVQTTLSAGETVTLIVPIEIKPGDPDKSVKLGTGGVVPVAIFSTTTFDARSVDPATVRLASAPVKMAGKSDRFLCNAEDVNDDAVPDLVCQVITSQLEVGEGPVVLNATTSDGQHIRGSDTVRVVP